MLTLLATIAGRPAQAQATNPLPRYILTDTEAIVLNQPEMAAEGRIVSAQWSPDGRCAIAVRETQQKSLGLSSPRDWTVSVMTWRQDTRRVKELWHSPITLKDNLLKTMQIKWLPTSSVAIVTLITREPIFAADTQNGGTKELLPLTQGLLWIDAARDRVVEIPQLLGDDLEISPTRPLAFLFHSSRLTRQGDDTQVALDNTFQVIGSDGTPGVVCAKPAGRIVDTYWMKGGNALAFRTMTRSGEDDPPVFNWYARDAQTGEVSPLDTKPERPNAAPARPSLLKVRQESATLKSGVTQTVTRPLWLDSGVPGEQRTLLLSADAQEGLVSPAGNAVLYITSDGAWVVPLTRRPKAAFLAELRASSNNPAAASEQPNF